MTSRETDNMIQNITKGPIYQMRMYHYEYIMLLEGYNLSFHSHVKNSIKKMKEPIYQARIFSLVHNKRTLHEYTMFLLVTPSFYLVTPATNFKHKKRNNIFL